MYYKDGNFDDSNSWSHSCFYTEYKNYGGSPTTNYDYSGTHIEESILKVDINIADDWEVTQVLHNANWFGNDA